MTDTKLSFSPSHDEAARQGFVSAVKIYANMFLEQQVDKTVEQVVLPRFEAEHGRPARLREDVQEAVEALPIYQYWGAMTYYSQDMLFDSVAQTVDRTADAQNAIAQQLTDSPTKLGSLHLSDQLDVSAPIDRIAIHRQPGGYVGQGDDDPMRAGRLYSGTFTLYRNAKPAGDGSVIGADVIGQAQAGLYKKMFGDKQPRRILDIGCGTGEQTVGLKRAFPDAEVIGVDCAAPLLRYAHAWAENERLAVAFHQMNAQQLDFPDDHFDLIVSHILFHETSHVVLPAIFKEAHRVLAPGGAMMNLDVAYQPDRISLALQVTHNWQVKYNGEPFWTGFGHTDLRARLKDAGFAEDDLIYEYVPFGAGEYLMFGGVKTV